MRVRVALPDRHVDAATLNALLEAVTRAGTRQILSGDASDFRDVLERRAIAWKPEPFTDGEHFDMPAVVQERRWGDCDDLGPYLAASYRASGDDPGARAIARRSGANRWHVVVRRSNGKVEDPSKWAGMKSTVSGPGSGVRALPARPMAFAGDGAIALTRARNGPWWARCDLPWRGAPLHLASLSPGTSPDQAVSRAIMGALFSSDGCSRDHRKFAELVAGDLLDAWDDPQPGNIFGDITRTKGTGMPGGSIARGLCAAAPLDPRHGRIMKQAPLANGAGSATWTSPAGPVVIRF